MASLLHPPTLEVALRRVGTLRPDAPARWGTMNAHQAVCHLSDAFRMVLGDRPLPDQSSFFLRTVVRFVALSLPVPFPRGAPTARGLNQAKGGGTPPLEFARDVEELKGLMRRFAETEGCGLHPHVAFGALSPGEWGRWAWRHTDHHLRQFGA